MSDIWSAILFTLFFALPVFGLIMIVIFIATKVLKINLGLIHALLICIFIYLMLGILVFFSLFLNSHSGSSNSINISDVIFIILSWPPWLIGFRS